MASLRLEELKKELVRIRAHLLPNAFDPTGSYPDEVITRTIAYRVLSHAELESYIEDRVSEIAREAVRAFVDRGDVRLAAVALLAFSGLSGEVPPESLTAPQPSQAKAWPDRIDLECRLRRAGAAFVEVVKKNHGVKEANLLQLLLPVGIRHSELDPAWLSTMTGFGTIRGQAAHESGSAIRMKQLPDPLSESKMVDQILAELAVLDAKLDTLLT